MTRIKQWADIGNDALSKAADKIGTNYGSGKIRKGFYESQTYRTISNRQKIERARIVAEAERIRRGREETARIARERLSAERRREETDKDRRIASAQREIERLKKKLADKEKEASNSKPKNRLLRRLNILKD